MHHDLHLVGRQVIHLFDLDLALLVGLDDRLFDRLRCCRERNFGDHERTLIHLRYSRTHLHCATAQTIVISARIHQTSRREVGQQLKILPLQMRYAGRDELVEVMRQDLRCQTHGNTLGSLRQQQRELNGQRYRLLVSAVVRTHPLGSLLVIDHLEGKLRQSRLDVSSRSRVVAREDITPVTLRVDQKILLTNLHQRILYRRIAVRVVRHRLTDDVLHLVVSSVVAALHRVEYSTLYGLQSILDVRHRTLQNNVRCVVQKPILVHSRQLLHIRPIAKQTVVAPLLRLLHSL